MQTGKNSSKTQPTMTELLMRWGRVDPFCVAHAMAVHQKWGMRMGRILVELGFCNREDIVHALAAQAGLKAVDLPRVVSDPRAVALVPREVAERCQAVPLRLGGDRQSALAAAIVAPVKPEALEELRRVTGKTIVPYVAHEDDVADALVRLYSKASASRRDEDDTGFVIEPLAACV